MNDRWDRYLNLKVGDRVIVYGPYGPGEILQIFPAGRKQYMVLLDNPVGGQMTATVQLDALAGPRPEVGNYVEYWVNATGRLPAIGRVIEAGDTRERGPYVLVEAVEVPGRPASLHKTCYVPKSDVRVVNIMEILAQELTQDEP